MNEHQHKTMRAGIYGVIAIIALFVFMDLFHTKINSQPDVIVTHDTLRYETVIKGQDWKPIIVTVGDKSAPTLPLNYDSLATAYLRLYKDFNSTVRYDTTLKDSVSSERLQFAIRENRLQDFKRNLTLINTTTEKIKKQAFAIYGGGILHTTNGITSPALSLTYQSTSGYLYSFGKDITGTGFVVSASLPLYRHYK